MPRALKPCSTAGCPELTEAGTTKCQAHAKAAAKVRDQRRQTSRQRGYMSAGHRKFRRQVLARDSLCVLCGKVATVADHYPKSRRDLVAEGLNPNDPSAGRGLCASCHGRETVIHQPGGWNVR